MALTKIDDRGLNTPIDLLDNEKIRFGTGNDLELYHDGSNSYIDNSTGNLYLRSGGNQISIRAKDDEQSILAHANGAVELYHDNNKKFETHTNGVHMSGSMYFPDSQIAGFGDVSNPDLRIYHDGNHSYISDTGTGALILKSNDFNVQSDTGETMIWGDDNAAVKLYYDGSPKFETTSDGTQTTGRSRIYYGGNAGKPTLLIGANNEQGSTSLTNATQKACRVGMPHYTNAEEPTNMFHGVSGDGIAEVRYGGGTSYMNAATSHRFYTAANTTTTGGTEHMRIESDGDLRLSSDDVDTNYGFIDGWSGASGDMVLGSDHSTTGSNGSNIIFKTRGGEKVRIQHGGGISFNGDTAADNALDDYEEGTWTPAISEGTAGHADNKYIKIGKIVHFFGRVHNPTDISSSNIFTVTGLPFPVAASGTAGSCFGKEVNATGATTTYVTTAEYIRFYGHNAGNAWTYVQYNGLATSNCEIYYSGTYHTT